MASRDCGRRFCFNHLGLAVTFILLFSGRGSWLSGVTAQDPCQTTLNVGENNRSPQYIPDPANDVLICDVGITSEWVRFDRVAPPGTEAKMPESCVDYYHCGTQLPIWMNGVHPTAANPGPVTVQVCSKTSDDSCCGWSSNIQVKWCNPGFYVYKLAQPAICDMAYCFDDTFTPPPDMPNLKIPVMSPPFISDSKDVIDYKGQPMKATVFSVTCTVGFETQYTGNEVACIEVNLVTDEGIPLLPSSSRVIKSPTADTVITIGEEFIAGHCGHSIKCSAVAYFDSNHKQRTLMKYSAGFWFGLVPESTQYNFKSPTPVTLAEGQTMTMWLKCTFPVTTRKCYENPTERCFSAYSFCMDGAKEGGPAVQSCNIALAAGGTDQTTNVIVSPFATVGIRQQPFLVLLRFQHVATISTQNSIFENYILDPIPIYINDGTIRPLCTSWGDPHLTTFGATAVYDSLHDIGDYYLLKNKNPGRTFEIQVQHRICNPVANIVCNCGMIVREGNNVLGINACKASNLGPVIVRYLTASDPDVPDATIVTIVPNHQWKIWLPSGIEIVVDSYPYGLNIYLYGLNDIEYTGFCAVGTTQDNYKQYAVPAENSLFKHLATCVNEDYSVTPCTCKRQQNSNTLSVCDNLVNTGTSTAALVPAGRNICNTGGAVGKRRKRDLSNSGDVVVPDYLVLMTDDYQTTTLTPQSVPVWPTPKNGITEEQARIACQNSMKVSSAYDFCISNNLVDESQPLRDCMLDIQLSDDLNISQMYQDVIETHCMYGVRSLEVLQSDNGTIITPPDYQNMLYTIKNLTCPGQCAPGGIKRGTCSNGECICNPGFAEVDCSLETEKSPVIAGILPKCYDYQQLNQTGDIITIMIQGDNIDRLGKLSCRATVEDGYPDPGLQPVYPSKFCSGMLACFYKASNLQPGRLYSISISISNNDLTYSDEISYKLYDSNCVSCDEKTGDTTLKDGYCLRNGECFNLMDGKCIDTGLSLSTTQGTAKIQFSDDINDITEKPTAAESDNSMAAEVITPVTTSAPTANRITEIVPPESGATSSTEATDIELPDQSTSSTRGCSCAKWTGHDNFYSLGATLYSPAKSLQDCQSKCCEDQSCVAVDFDSKSVACWIHTKKINLVLVMRTYRKDWFQYLIHRNEGCNGYDGIKWKVTLGLSSSGAISYGTDTTLEECQMYCASLPSCLGIDFYSNKLPYCWIHTDPKSFALKIKAELSIQYTIQRK